MPNIHSIVIAFTLTEVKDVTPELALIGSVATIDFKNGLVSLNLVIVSLSIG